jgi:hypothetical protein
MKLCATCMEVRTCDFPENFRELEFRHTGSCRNFRPNIKRILELEDLPISVESVTLMAGPFTLPDDEGHTIYPKGNQDEI